MADGKLTVSLVVLHVKWDDEARERFIADACENCQVDLDNLGFVEVFMQPMRGGRFAAALVLCSVECADQAIDAYKEITGE